MEYVNCSKFYNVFNSINIQSTSKKTDKDLKLYLDNIIFSLQKAGGISVYWYELLKRLQNSGNNFISFEKKNNNIFSRQLLLETQQESFLPARIYRFLRFSKKTYNEKFIFHSSYYRVSLSKNCLNITTVHDFTYEFYAYGLKRKIHHWQKVYAIKRSAGIICVSENTKKDLLKFIPSIDQNRIKVIYNGVGDEFFPIKNLGNDLGFMEIHDKKFVLFIGDRSSYKNFDKVIGLLQKIPDFFLVVIGGKPYTNDEIAQLNNVKNRVFTYKGVDSVALNWLYNRSFCLIYPSEYEGFGIPVLEAMKAGCPVICTNRSSLPEVAGEAAILVDEPTVDELSKKVKLLEDKSFRNDLIKKGFIQASKFSWDKCFQETLDFYKEIWNRAY